MERRPVTLSLRSRAGSERREGAGSPDAEILRYAQDDSQDTAPVRSREAFAPNVYSAFTNERQGKFLIERRRDFPFDANNATASATCSGWHVAPPPGRAR